MSEMEMAAEWVLVNDLIPWEENPRINDHAVSNVAQSIKRFGFGAPIVARKEGMVIIAGHTRWKAAVSLGLDRVPVRLLDVDEDEARALALADNRLGQIAEWSQTLSDILGDLQEKGFDLSGPLGFTVDEIEALLDANSFMDLDFDEESGEIEDSTQLRESCITYTIVVDDDHPQVLEVKEALSNLVDRFELVSTIT